MARTLHMQLSPSRRSKRLVNNGYYVVPPGGDAINSSEDDDNLSIHSNSSSVYSERSVKYRESPSIATRRKRFRKQLGDSPRKHSVNTAEHTAVQGNLRFTRGNRTNKEKVTASTSSTLLHGEPVVSQSTTQLERWSVTTPLMPPPPNNLSAGDRVVFQTAISERATFTSNYSTGEESVDQSRKDIQNESIQHLTLQSIVVALHQFLFSLVRNVVYSISKIIYLTALTVYSWEVKVLAWRVGAVPWRILKFLFFLLLLLATTHLAAKHTIGDDYVTITRETLSQGWAGIWLRHSKASSTVPPTVMSNEGRDSLLHSQDFEAALANIEVTFAFKFSEVKQSIQSLQEDLDKTQQHLRRIEDSKKNTDWKLQEDLDKTRQHLQKIEDSKKSTDSKLALLQANFEGQQKTSDTVQREVTDLKNTFQVSAQEFATKKELNDRAMALATQQSQLNDLIMNMMEKYDGQIGNETRVREIVTIQFVESFLSILRSTEASDEDASRVQAMFLSWLNKHGYVTKEEIDSDLRSLQGLYATKLERVRQDTRRHSSTITLEKIVERPLVEQQQAGTRSDIEAEVKKWIQEALAMYSADRIGLADHALESAGGFIASTRCSESFDKKTALVSILGIPFYYNINTPRSVIQPGNFPGECWSFKGSEGYVVIALSGSVRPTSFSLEHIPRELSLAGHIDSAPKDFVVLGLADIYDEKGIVLGSYRYDKDGAVVQQFAKMTDNQEFFAHVELRVRSNWGNPTYTCLYRFRVHGQRAGSKNPLL